MADDGESIFAKAGFELPGKAAASPEKKATAKSAAPSIFEAAGFKIPGGVKEEAPEPASNIPTPARFAEGVEKYGVNNHPQQSMLQQIHEAIDPSTLLTTGAKNAYHDTIENAVAGSHLVGQGLTDIGNKNYLPTTPSMDPSTWSPGGLLKTAGGALGILTSPIAGAANALVAKPVTALTGNPDIGERAGFVASSITPVRGGNVLMEKAAPSTKSMNKLVEAVGPENVPQLVASMRQNPRMTPADLSDPVRLTTQGLMAGGTPDVQQFISKAVKERAGSRLEAANTAYTEAMGPKPDVVKMVEGLKDRARTAGQQAIQPALENAKPVDVTPVIKAIDEKLKPGVTALLGDTKLPLSELEQELVRFKSRLTDGENQVFDPQKLHRIQSEIGDQAFQLSKSPNPKDRMLGSQLRTFNEKLIDQIDEASKIGRPSSSAPSSGFGSETTITINGKPTTSRTGASQNISNETPGQAANAPGPYRQARAKFKDAKDIHEAFDAGFDTLKNRSGKSGLEDRPEAFREWMKTATPEEVVARRIGTRADIDQKINGVKNGALAGQGITAIPYNREKLQALFGDKEASRLIRVMEDAKREADTNYAIHSGSKTAETNAAKERIEVRKVGGGNSLQSFVLPAVGEGLNYMTSGSVLPGAGAALAGAAMLARRGVQKVGQMHDIASNMEFAKNALAAGPAREATINRLLSHPKVIRELKKRSNALTVP